MQNPGARYSASTKAVVRIYLKKEQGEGFSLDNETRYGYIYDHTVWENLALNFRKDGFDIGLKLWGERQIYGHDNIVNQNTYLDEKWTQAAFSHIRNKSWHWAPTLTLNWQLSEDKSFGMRYSYYRLPKQMPHGSFIDTDVRRNDVSMERSMALITSKYSTWNHATNLYYSGKTSDWQIDVNADMYFSDNRTHGCTAETVENLTDHTTETFNVTTENPTRNSLYAIKAVAAHLLWGGQITFGTEDSYSRCKNSYSNPQHIVKDDKSKINEALLAGFAEYNHTFGKLYANLGLRFEHTNSNYYEYDKRIDEQSRKYNDWFPNVSLSMPVAVIKKAPVQMSLSYSRDISRPDYSSLRSGIHYDNKYSLEGGNPLLSPTYSDNISLNAAWKWVNISTGFSHIKNEISLFSEPYKTPDGVEHPEISYLHPVELDSYDTWHFALNIAPSIGRGWNNQPLWSPKFVFYLRGQNYHADTKDGKRIFNHPTANFALPHDWHLDADYRYQTSGYFGNIHMYVPIQEFSFTILKTWCKDKIETRLRISDAFNQQNHKVMVYNGLRELENLQTARRGIEFTFRYKFNTARSKYKGQGAGSSQKNRM